MSLYYVEKTLPDVMLLDLRGKITLGDETAVLRQEVMRLLDAGHTRIILNLAGVNYIDSSGLSTLIACYASARKRGAELKLLNLTKSVRDLMQITRLSTIFEAFNSLEEARASFGRVTGP